MGEQYIIALSICNLEGLKRIFSGSDLIVAIALQVYYVLILGIMYDNAIVRLTTVPGKCLVYQNRFVGDALTIHDYLSQSRPTISWLQAVCDTVSLTQFELPWRTKVFYVLPCE